MIEELYRKLNDDDSCKMICKSERDEDSKDVKTGTK